MTRTFVPRHDRLTLRIGGVDVYRLNLERSQAQAVFDALRNLEAQVEAEHGSAALQHEFADALIAALRGTL